jgi:hypothetical protein
MAPRSLHRADRLTPDPRNTARLGTAVFAHDYVRAQLRFQAGLRRKQQNAAMRLQHRTRFKTSERLGYSAG